MSHASSKKETRPRARTHEAPRRTQGLPPAQGHRARAAGGPPPLHIGKVSERFLLEGHAWSTKDKELGDLSPYRPGDIVELVNPEGQFVAQALLDPASRVVARVLSWDRKPTLDPSLLRKRALDAAARRAPLARIASAYRLVHGEADGLPGLVIDHYDGHLVAALYTPAAAALAELSLNALLDSGSYTSAYLKELPRDRRASDGHTGRVIRGEPGPASFVIHEYGVRFQVQPFAGLPTGLYLDMRDNRRLLGELLSGLRVLNAFAYTGGFSVTCALQGAQTLTLDLSSKTLGIARENFVLNGLDPQGHRFLAEDIFVFLSQTTETFDAILLDPPTFSTGREGTWSPGRVIELNALALRALSPGGRLVSFSNFAGLSEPDFLQSLWAASREARRPMQVERALQAGPDFPWLPGFPESRHLKGFVLRLL